MIIGTGSVVFSRINGKCTRIGGWGYLTGDEGSGFDMGRRALNAAFRYADGRGSKTLLTQMIEQHGKAPIDQIAEKIDEGGRTTVATYSRVLIQAAEAGDPIALEQFRICVEELQLMIKTAQKEMNSETMQVVLAGGVVMNSEFLWKNLQKGMEKVKLIRLSRPPVCGSVLEAIGHVPQGFYEQYMTDYHTYRNGAGL